MKDRSSCLFCHVAFFPYKVRDFGRSTSDVEDGCTRWQDVAGPSARRISAGPTETETQYYCKPKTETETEGGGRDRARGPDPQMETQQHHLSPILCRCYGCVVVFPIAGRGWVCEIQEMKKCDQRDRKGRTAGRDDRKGLGSRKDRARSEAALRQPSRRAEPNEEATSSSTGI